MLYVEIADNPESWQKGLMFRKHLPENRGMLFKFNHPQVLKFWGLNTYIPLDIAFVDHNNRIKKIGKIKEMSMKTISSENDCLMAIEANDDFFAENNIKAGDKINLKKDKDGNLIIDFLRGENIKSANFIGLGYDGIGHTLGDVMWIWDGEKFEIKKVKKPDEDTHQDLWGFIPSGDYSNTWQGRFEPSTKRLSIIPPYGYNSNHIPEDLKAELDLEFPGNKKFLFK